MEKSSQIIGLPVLCGDSGKKLGIVKDIVYCPSSKEVKGIILENTGWRMGKRLIFFDSIKSFGNSAVIVSGPACAMPLRKARGDGRLKNKGEILGLRVYSKKGEDMGVVKDVLFDPKTGIVEGVEVSDGYIQDIVQGRRIMPLFGKVEFGDEAMLVDKDAVEEAESTGGGIRNWLLEK